MIPEPLIEELLDVERACYKEYINNNVIPYDDKNWLHENWMAIPIVSRSAALWVVSQYVKQVLLINVAVVPLNAAPSSIDGVMVAGMEIGRVPCPGPQDQYDSRPSLMMSRGMAEQAVGHYGRSLIVYQDIGGVRDDDHIQPMIDLAEVSGGALILDAANGQYLDYEDFLFYPSVIGVVYEFMDYLPIGGGALILTRNELFYNYAMSLMRRNEGPMIGMDLSVMTSRAMKIRHALTSQSFYDFYHETRVRMVGTYHGMCSELGAMVYPNEGSKFNGYKFAVLGKYIETRMLGEIGSSPIYLNRQFPHFCLNTGPGIDDNETYAARAGKALQEIFNRG